MPIKQVLTSGLITKSQSTEQKSTIHINTYVHTYMKGMTKNILQYILQNILQTFVCPNDVQRIGWVWKIPKMLTQLLHVLLPIFSADITNLVTFQYSTKNVFRMWKFA